MNLTLFLAITVVVIELASFAIKKWLPKFVGYIPFVNSIIGVVASLICKQDILTGLVTAGVTCGAYDLLKGIIDAIIGPKQIEAKNE